MSSIIPSYFFIFSSYSFITLHVFFIFLGLGKIPSFPLGSGTSILPGIGRES